MKSGKVLSVTKVVMLPPAGVRGLYNLIAGSPGRKKGGMHHGVERCSAAVRHCWRHSWDYISDRMGNLQRDP